MKKSLIIISTLILIVLSISSANLLAATIGMSQSMLAGSPWWDVMVNSVKDELAKAGHELIVLDAEGNVAKQMSDIEDLIARGVDLIAVNPYDSYAVVPATLKAKEAGIPVIAVDVPVAPEGYAITTVIANNRYLGYLNGWHLADLVNKDHAKALIIAGYPAALCSRDRYEGFLAGFITRQIEKYNRSNLEVIFHAYANYDFTPAYDVTQDIIIRSEGDFDIIFTCADVMSLAAQKALEDAGDKGTKYIGGVDGLRAMYEKIMEGKIHCTGLNSPFEIGVKTAETVVKILNGENVPSEVFTNPVLVTKDNVKDYYDPNQNY